MFDGCESLRDGEHGLPDCRDDGQARLPRLLRGGCHGQGKQSWGRTLCSVCTAEGSGAAFTQVIEALQPDEIMDIVLSLSHSLRLGILSP